MRHNSNVYSGQFSTDGNFFYSCSQDFKVRMYDTSNPYNWEHYKTSRYEGGRWTITDATLSPDNKMLAYSSITPVVYVSNTQPGAEGTWAMDFCVSRSQTRSIMERNFGVRQSLTSLNYITEKLIRRCRFGPLDFPGMGVSL